MSDKSEEPTPRRLRRAREEGDSGVSAYAAQAVAFLAVVGLVPGALAATAARTAADLRALTAHGAVDAVSALRFDPTTLAGAVLTLTLPLLAAAGTASVIVQVVQTGGVVASQRLVPELDRLNPIAGLRSLFSMARAFAVLRALSGGAIVGWLAWGSVHDHLLDLARTSGRSVWIPTVVSRVAGGLALKAALVGVALGGLDLVVTRRAWTRRLRMSKDEVKREHRDAEGDPSLRAARDRAHREVIAQATVHGVRNATVVVVNPTHVACALRYDGPGGDRAPVVVASGAGEFAARIARAAHDYGVPVVRDVPLARALAELEVGDAIPEALYEAVAVILSELENPKSGLTPAPIRASDSE